MSNTGRIPPIILATRTLPSFSESKTASTTRAGELVFFDKIEMFEQGVSVGTFCVALLDFGDVNSDGIGKMDIFPEDERVIRACFCGWCELCVAERANARQSASKGTEAIILPSD